MQCYVFPGKTPTSSPRSSPPSAASLEEERASDDDQWEDVEQTEVAAGDDLDTTILYYDDEDLDATVCYGKDDVPPGKRFCS